MHKYLSFAGGGTRGFAYIGALEALCEWYGAEAFSREIRGCVGTSAGAVAALIAVLGMDMREMRSHIAPVLQSPHAIAPCLDLNLFLSKYGLDNGEALRSIIRNLIHVAGLSPRATLGDVYRLLGKQLVCCTTNLATGRARYLSPHSAPNMEVADAVFMSMCVPFLFTPVQHEGDLHVDGALSENVPRYFDPKETMHVLFERQTEKRTISNWADYAASIVLCREDVVDWLQPHAKVLVRLPAYIQSEGSLNLNMRQNTAQQLIACGYASMLEALSPHFQTVLEGTLRACCRMSCDARLRVAPPAPVN